MTTPHSETPSTAHVSTILLAEDEQTVLSFLEKALTRAGHLVIAAPSGDDAFLRGSRSSTPIDLLVADVVMPGLSGPEVAEKLSQYHPQMRSLFLSGSPRPAALADRVVTDPAAFLQKPFTVETLLARVRERLAD